MRMAVDLVIGRFKGANRNIFVGGKSSSGPLQREDGRLSSITFDCGGSESET